MSNKGYYTIICACVCI